MIPTFTDNQKRHVTGRISQGFLVFIGTVAAFVAVGLWQYLPRGSSPAQAKPLVVFCAAGLKPVAEVIARDFEKTCGIPVQLQFGGSQTLLASLEVSRRGDLYLPAEDAFLTLARNKNLIDEALPAAVMTAVLAVPRGNPKGIHTLEDLAGGSVKIAQANPDAAAIGKVVRDVLQPGGLWQRIHDKTTVFKPTVNDVANDLKLGTVDAGFIWDAMLHQYPELERVPVPALSNANARVSVAVLKSATHPAAALRFARFLTAPETGKPVWIRFGFRAIPGDTWVENPEVQLFAGAMLRVAIDETVNEFERREGVRVTRVYNGCGILVSEMRTGKHPDAYFACDASFMRQVTNLFNEPVTVSANQMVVLTVKENPRGISQVADLARPGLKVGLAHEQQSALGALTSNLLQALHLYEPIKRNVTVYSATGDFLVNQLRTGALDAVIVYFSNGAMVSNQVTMISIPNPAALATQPIAVGRSARFPLLAERLRHCLLSPESKARFLAAGFDWQAPVPAR